MDVHADNESSTSPSLTEKYDYRNETTEDILPSYAEQRYIWVESWWDYSGHGRQEFVCRSFYNGEERPAAYASRILTKADRQYCVTRNF